MPAPIPPQRAELAKRLRELRATAFSTGTAFAAHMVENYGEPWRQTRVSKLERGEQRPTETDLHQWIDATGTTETGDELWSLLSAARIEYATFAQSYRAHGGPVGDQHDAARSESAATRIRHYQPAMIPGLLQTAAYARELLASPTGPTYFGATRTELEGMVHARIQRQNVLYDQAKTVEFVLGEAALHTNFGSTSALVGQLDRLTQISDLATVELAVVPFTAAAPVFPLSGFSLRDDAVTIETLAGEHTLDDPADVALYKQAFKHLREVALSGDDAVALIQRVTGELRA